MDYDAKWHSIIQEMDEEVSKRVYNEASAILPFSILEEDLQNAQCTPEGFQAMIRSQTMHLLLKKGPRQHSIKGELEKKTRNEEEPVEHTELIAPSGRNARTVKMRYKAKRLAEQKVVASLFHFLWPPEVYGFNPITIEVRPLSSNMRRKCKTKPLSTKFASYRLKWQFKMVAEKVVSHARDMKQMCARIPTYMKQFPVLFFNLARMFVAAHCEPYVEVEGGVQNYEATKPLKRKETVELLSKTSRSFENFRRSMRHVHKKAGIVHNDSYLDGAFRAMLKSAEAFLADLSILASPYLVYDDKLYLKALIFLRCSEGNVSCREYPEVCFLDRTTEEDLVFDKEWGDVDIGKVLQLPLQGSNRNSLEAFGFAANFMQSCSKVYEKRLRELQVPEKTIAALRMRISESATVSHGFPMVHNLQHPVNMSEANDNNCERVKQAQCQVLVFWRCIFDSVKELVRSSASSAAKHDVESTSFYVEEIIGVSALANTILRPQSVGELITKITEKEVSDILDREESGTARRRSSKKNKGFAKPKARAGRPSVFGREGFEPDTSSSEGEEEVSSGQEEGSSFDSEGDEKGTSEGEKVMRGTTIDVARNEREDTKAPIEEEVPVNMSTDHTGDGLRIGIVSTTKKRSKSGENTGKADSNSAIELPIVNKLPASPIEQYSKMRPDATKTSKEHTIPSGAATSLRRSRDLDYGAPRNSPQKPPPTKKAARDNVSKLQDARETDIGEKEGNIAQRNVGERQFTEEGSDRPATSELDSLEEDIFGPEETLRTGGPNNDSISNLQKRRRHSQSLESKHMTLRPRKQQK